VYYQPIGFSELLMNHCLARDPNYGLHDTAESFHVRSDVLFYECTFIVTT